MRAEGSGFFSPNFRYFLKQKTPNFCLILSILTFGRREKNIWGLFCFQRGGKSFCGGGGGGGGGTQVRFATALLMRYLTVSLNSLTSVLNPTLHMCHNYCMVCEQLLVGCFKNETVIGNDND